MTGGSSGLGALMVRMFAAKNITVIILDLTAPKGLDQSVYFRSCTTQFCLAKCTGIVPTVCFYKADITSSEKLHELGEKIRNEHGEPTVLINNAGVGSNKNILDESEEQIRRTFDVNTVAHFLLFKEFGPAMIKHNHGHIVTIASLASFLVHAQNVDYTCTKASALAFHEGIAQELKSRYNANKVRTT